jgi:elongation factor Ts
MIKKLREATQVSMMDCKKALTESGGDYEKAVELLRKKGASVAAKRADNATNNGSIQVSIAPDFRSGAILEAACETDFSANTQDMRDFTTAVSGHILATGKTVVASSDSDVAALMNEELTGRPGLTVQGRLEELISKISESIKVARFARLSGENSMVNAYVHPGSTIGVLVELAVDGQRPADITDLAQAAKDVAMQAAVTRPLCITPDQLDESVVAKEREIFAEQLRGEGKNDQIIEKIMPGKLSKFYESVCLNNQKFIKDDKQTIAQMLTAVGKAAGCTLRIANFVRFSI